MFGPLAIERQWRTGIESGAIAGPRMVFAGALVDGPKPAWPGSIAVGDAEAGRSAVRSQKSAGADFIKVYDLLPREAYFAIAGEARKQGIPVAGHIPASVSAREASDAGQRSIEHLDLAILVACSTREEVARRGSPGKRRCRDRQLHGPRVDQPGRGERSGQLQRGKGTRAVQTDA